jgi:hypothetical protein
MAAEEPVGHSTGHCNSRPITVLRALARLFIDHDTMSELFPLHLKFRKYSREPNHFGRHAAPTGAIRLSEPSRRLVGAKASEAVQAPETRVRGMLEDRHSVSGESATLLGEHLERNIESLDGAQQIGSIDEIGFPALRASRGEMRHGPGKAFGRCGTAMRTGKSDCLGICHRDGPRSRIYLTYRC